MVTTLPSVDVLQKTKQQQQQQANKTTTTTTTQNQTTTTTQNKTKNNSKQQKQNKTKQMGRRGLIYRNEVSSGHAWLFRRGKWKRRMKKFPMLLRLSLQSKEIVRKHKLNSQKSCYFSLPKYFSSKTQLHDLNMISQLPYFLSYVRCKDYLAISIPCS